ncbi:MAG: ROK family transcriptional regulator [Clostridiales bacterium]|nr:ROK family transcriptional regulator [Clostridiales bacterium]
MGYSGINLENVKSFNRSAILKLLNDQGEMSRKDIAARLGLTPATVSVICSELLAAQILCEMGEMKEDRRAGRKKILLGINYSRFFVLSVSIEDTDTCVTLSDMRCRPSGQRRLATDENASPEEFLCRVAEAGRELLRDVGVDAAHLLGAGVSIPGTVRRENGICLSYRLWEGKVNVREILQRELGLPVIVENNVKAFAEAEMVYGSGKEQENLLFVKWGPGVGASFVIHKQIYESRRFKSAEIGHMITGWEDPGTGRICCGRLETRVSTHAIADQVRAQCTQEAMPQLYRNRDGDLSSIAASNITEWIACGDRGMWQIVEADVDLLARAVCNIVTFLAPDQTIFYGNMFELPTMRERFLAACQRYSADYREGDFSRSRLSDKLDYIGPLAIVVNELFLSGRAVSALGANQPPED